MPQPWYDPSSKWMVEEQGAGILYLGGARNVLSCKARKAEVVQPRQLPDGLLEVRFAGSAEPSLVVIEIATYPEERVVEQIQDDIRLVRQSRGVLADALVVCLAPKGNSHVPEQIQQRSALGWTSETLSWKVIEVWTMKAEELLAAPDVGAAVFALAAHHEGSPEVLLQRCRDRIEREGGKHKANLLAVAQVFARLHYDKLQWLDIFGGSKAMIESPLIQEIVEESKRVESVDNIVHVLQGKFGPVGDDISAGLTQVKEKERLRRLLLHAATCRALQDFEEHLRAELPKPAPPSTRGKRRSRKASE
jgi:hypothetical protein